MINIFCYSYDALFVKVGSFCKESVVRLYSFMTDIIQIIVGVSSQVIAWCRPSVLPGISLLQLSFEPYSVLKLKDENFIQETSSRDKQGGLLNFFFLSASCRCLCGGVKCTAISFTILIKNPIQLVPDFREVTFNRRSERSRDVIRIEDRLPRETITKWHGSRNINFGFPLNCLRRQSFIMNPWAKFKKYFLLS